MPHGDNHQPGTARHSDSRGTVTSTARRSQRRYRWVNSGVPGVLSVTVCGALPRVPGSRVCTVGVSMRAQAVPPTTPQARATLAISVSRSQRPISHRRGRSNLEWSGPGHGAHPLA